VPTPRRALPTLLALPLGVAAATFSVGAPSIGPDGAIPTDHTCQGRNRSPALRFAAAPPGARSLALLLEDPDAHAPERPPVSFVHWVLYDLPPSCQGLPEGLLAEDLPAGTREGLNDKGEEGYFGPCPQEGRHRYHLHLYALDRRLGEGAPLSGDGLRRAMEGHVLAEAELVFSYERQNRFMARLKRLFGR